MSAGPPPLLGVVIPTLDEARYLPLLLDDLALLELPFEIVVSDGGSTDGTPRLARERGARVVRAPRGRASQLAAGARETGADWLLFLHADVRLPSRARRALLGRLENPDPRRAAHFAFALDGDGWFWRFVELGQRIRERTAGLAYGDQGLLVSRQLFRDVGGYPDQPLMEDVEIVRRLRRRAAVDRIDAPLLTSPRRYEREGKWLGWLRNAALLSLYLAGVPPERLARWYRPEPEPPADAVEGGRERTLLVFAKAPEPGQVKTRLARDVGERAAADFYRRLGRRVVDQLRGGGYRTLVAYAPADAGDRIRAWLGDEGLGFLPQGSGDLGERMAAAFDRAFTNSDAVCIVGTDAPDVDRTLVERAFRALEEADVVLGPARDGGYYLMALNRPAPELFRDVPWSTPDVLDTTLERARAAGLRVRLLEERSDVDTAADLDPGTLARLEASRKTSG